MKVTWELDPINPNDAQLLNAMHKLIQFVPPGETAEAPKVERATGPATSTEPAKAEPAKTEAPAAKTKKKRQPKAKNKDQLLAMGLDEIVEYLGARREHTVLECRALALHYSNKFCSGETSPIVEVLHNVGANSFDDLENTTGFIKAIFKLIEGQKNESGDQDESKGDDPFGF